MSDTGETPALTPHTNKFYGAPVCSDNFLSYLISVLPAQLFISSICILYLLLCLGSLVKLSTCPIKIFFVSLRSIMYAIAIILLGIAMVLQVLVGNISIRLFAMPMNIILLIGLLCAIGFTPSDPKNKVSKAFTDYGTRQGAVFCFALGVAAMLLLALLPQYYATANWTFPVVIILLLYSLGLAIRRRLLTFCIGHQRRNIAFLITHTGLFLALAAGCFGAADSYTLHQLSYIGQPSAEAVQETENNATGLAAYTLPFSITTDDFIIETEDGETTAYKAILTLTNADSVSTVVTTATNRPVYYHGYHIYLSSYDRQLAGQTAYVVLDITKQPWQWLMLTGILLLLFGLCTYILKE